MKFMKVFILIYELNFEQLIQFIGNFRVSKSVEIACENAGQRNAGLIFIVQIAHSISLLIAR